MFCEKCGAQLPDNAEFCTNCGTNINGKIAKKATEKMPDTEVQLKIQPSFKFGYMVLPSIIVFGIFILIFSLIIGMASASAGFGVFVFCLILMAIILGIKTAINKKQYENYCYDFYKTKVIYRDSFLNVSEKEVKYKYIREVAMRQTFIQRLFNIGHIILYTNAETGIGNGILIMNVENVQDIYKNIKSIIDV